MTDDAPTDDLSDLRAELAALRAEVAALRADTAPRASGPPAAEDTGARHVSRRGLLAAAVAGGAGLVATQVTTAAPAAAAPGNALILGGSNDAGTTSTTLTSTPSSFTPVLLVSCTNDGTGLSGRSGSGWGVDARSTSGVGLSAQSDSGAAISAATSSGLYSIYGRAAAGIGVAGFSDGAYAGVRGESAISGPGVRGISEYGHGVHGHSARGVAVRAEAGTDETGQSPGPGTHAVDATATTGYGVQTKGGLAPLRLVPTGRVGAPPTGRHLIGELVVDKNGALFLCVAAGRPGTWKQVTVS